MTDRVPSLNDTARPTQADTRLFRGAVWLLILLIAGLVLLSFAVRDWGWRPFGDESIQLASIAGIVAPILTCLTVAIRGVIKARGNPPEVE